MISDQRRREIVAIFQTSFKRDTRDQIEAIPLSELIATDEMLGQTDLNAGFRIRLRNRIAELQRLEDRKENVRSLWVSHIVTFIGGIITALIGIWVANLLGG